MHQFPSRIQVLTIVACTLTLASGFISTPRTTSFILTVVPKPTTGTTVCNRILEGNAIKSDTTSSRLYLELPNFFGGGQFNFNPFGGNNDDDENSKDSDGNTSKYGGGGDGAIESDGDYVATTEIFHIPAKKIKVGGLRLYLALYFMGEQNTPERKTWRADQTKDGGIDLYFRDRTGALILTFEDEGLRVSRLGSAPSMEYLAQESYILGGMLDQLDEISDDSKIKEDDRLLCLVNQDEINRVRDNLAFE